jgi:glycine/D-amino acid oxidase-like deaminating enzyme
MTFPFTLDAPPRFAGPLPQAADVVIIGGGVIGVMTALYLAQAGESVVLVEKGRIAAEQSSRNWGWVRQQGRDPAELPIMMESMRLWQGLAQRLGEGLGFRQTGVMYLAESDGDLAGHERWLAIAREHGLDTQMMSRAGVEAMLGTAAAWKGALFTPSDARAEPVVAVPMLASLAASEGAVLVEHCAARALDLAAGRVAGVVTEAGTIRTGRVLVAAGAWSRLFLGAYGLALPQLAVLASVAATEPMPQIFPWAAADGHFAFRRRADGGYSLAPGAEHDFFIGPDVLRSFGKYLPVLKKDFRSTHFRPAAPQGYPDAWGTPRRWAGQSPFERCRILNPAPNMATIGRVRESFARAFPGLGRPVLKAVWAGMIDTMPDVVPVVDHAPGIPGLTIATGMSGHGFGIGPGMGRVLADLIRGRAPGHDLARFRLSRFSDGSKIDLGPSL